MYNPENDELVKLFELENDKNTLQISLMSLNKTKPKIQIVRSFQKKDGTVGYGKMGRLSKEELEYIVSISNEVFDIINNF